MALDHSALAAFIQEEKFKDMLWSTLANIHQTISMTDYVDVLTQNKEDSLKLPALAVTATWQDGATCGFSASGDDTLTQDTLLQKKVKINKDYCLTDWEAKMTAGYLSSGQHYEGLGGLESYLVGEILKNNAKQFENFVWRTTGTPAHSGIIPQVTAGAGVATSTGAVTASTALGFVDGLVTAAMANQDWAQFIADGDVILFLGTAEKWAYEQDYRETWGANTNATAMGLNQVIEGTNIQLRATAGLSGQGFMYLVRRGQIVVSTDLMSDLTDLRIYPDPDMEETRVKLRFKAGSLVRDEANLFFHKPA